MPIKIARRNPMTGKLVEKELDITTEQYERWASGELIQVAMPNLTPSEREFIITGIDDDSWDKIFNNEEEEDD